MSTPLSRNNKLQGPALYAPPRVRERAFSEDEAATAETPLQPESEQSESQRAENAQSENDLSEAENVDYENAENVDYERNADDYENDTDDYEDKADDPDALEWLDQAIRAVIELEHTSDHRPASNRRIAGPQSPSLAPAQDDSGGGPATPSDIGWREHGDPREVGRRHPRLEPEIVPEPPAAMRESGRFRQLVRYAWVIVFAAIAAYGLAMISNSRPGALWFKGTGDRIATTAPQVQQVQPDTRPPSRLVVEDQQAFANEPVSLKVNVEHGQQNELLVLAGLAQGTTLSAGSSTSPSTWQLPSNKVGDLYLYAPKDFVGVMNTAVDLVGPDRRLLDSRTMQLKWIEREPKPAPAPAPALATATAEATPAGQTAGVQSDSPPIEPIDPGEAAILMDKGRDFLSSGDISAARVAFRRLADSGNADAALALASTYDPDYLAAHNFLGVGGDRATARALYQRAQQLGSAEAGRILAQMQ